MMREHHPSGARSNEYGVAAMDEHPVFSRMFGNQSNSVRWVCTQPVICATSASVPPLLTFATTGTL